MSITDDPAVPAFDPDALREKYREERDKRIRPDGNEQYVEVDGRVRPLRRRPVRRADSTREPLTDDVDVVDHRRRLRRPARRRPAARGRRRRHPHHREGRRLRRHLVLEPLPGRACATSSRTSTSRCSRRSATSRRRSTPTRRRSSRTAGRSASTSTCTDNACFQTEVTEMRWDDDAARWIVSTNRGDAMRARFVCMANGPLHRPKLPGIAGHRDVRGPHVPHQPLGLRLHRRRLRRRASPGWPTSASGSSAPAPPRCSASRTSARRAEQLYVFQRTPSSIDVRDNRADRPGVGGEPASRAGSSSGWTTSTPSSPAASPRRTWSATAGPTSSASCSCMAAPGRDAGDVTRREHRRRRWSWPTSRRWSRSARASTRSSATRRRPRR